MVIKIRNFLIALRNGILGIFGFIAFIFIAEGVRSVVTRMSPKAEAKVQLSTEVVVDNALLGAAKQTGVKQLYLKVLAVKESSLQPHRVNDAPTVQRLIQRQKNETVAEARLRGSAIGLLGVVPYWHAKRCGLSTAEFFDAAKNAICGARHFADCIAKQKTARQSDKLFAAFACYHGGGVEAAEYAADAMRLLSKLAIEEGLI